MKLLRRTHLEALLCFMLFLNAFEEAEAASFGSGITYTGRITKEENPINHGTIRFYIWLQTQGGCTLYTEQRDVSMANSQGTFSFEVGRDVLSSTYPHTAFGVQNLTDVFNNAKTTSDLDTSQTGCASFTPTTDEGRLMRIQFLPPDETETQTLPDLVLSAVPLAHHAFNAQNLNGYDHSHVLKIDPAISSPANTDLNATQLTEFFRLLNNPTTAYLSAIPTLGGDISGTLGSVNVNKIKNHTVTAPQTDGTDDGKFLSFNAATGWSLQTYAGNSSITSLNGLTAATQSFAIGTAGNAPAFNSVTDTHTLNIPLASASSSVTAGLISHTEYAAFNTKQANALASGLVWIGNTSGGAEARTLSGDISSVSNTGSVAIVKTTTGEANKILALDNSGVANVKGLDVQTGTGKVTLQTNGAFTDYVLTLPTDDGNANQVLTTNGSGVLSWSNGPGDNLGNHTATSNIILNARWLSGDGDSEGIYINSNGRVGINDGTPSVMLELEPTATNAAKMRLNNSSGNTTVAEIEAGNFGPGGSTWKITSSGNSAAFQLQTASNTNYITNGLVMTAAGKVGVNTMSPSLLFEVTNNDDAEGRVAAFRSSAANPDVTLVLGGTATNDSNEKYITYQNYTTATNAWMAGMDDDEQFKIAYGNEGAILDAITKMTVLQTGQVGIGTVAPQAKLQVTGAIVSSPSSVTGATADLSVSNTVSLSSIGGSTITLQNMVHGGHYTLLINDTTSRTYTFSGCNTSKFKPANAATIDGTNTMYNIITFYNGSSYDCWITWDSGYQ